MSQDSSNDEEGASPDRDLKGQNAGETTTADLVDDDDSAKTEKLTKAGRDDMDPDQGSD